MMHNNLTEINPKRGSVLAVMVFLIFLILSIPGSIFLIFGTDIVFPRVTSFHAAVELENGEIYENYSLISMGAVNKKGELLLFYDGQNLAKYISLYLDPYYDTRGKGGYISTSNEWIITEANNPHYNGTIVSAPHNTNYFKSEKNFNSMTDISTNDIYYNQNGEIVWSYVYESLLDKPKDKLFERVMRRTSRSGGSRSFFIYCINVNQFLQQKYNIDMKMIVDKKNRLIIFSVPKNVERL
jgi:hypothetical protein